jgi:hypothetical protein
MLQRNMDIALRQGKSRLDVLNITAGTKWRSSANFWANRGNAQGLGK